MPDRVIRIWLLCLFLLDAKLRTVVLRVCRIDGSTISTFSTSPSTTSTPANPANTLTDRRSPFLPVPPAAGLHLLGASCLVSKSMTHTFLLLLPAHHHKEKNTSNGPSTLHKPYIIYPISPARKPRDAIDREGVSESRCVVGIREGDSARRGCEI
jgi:hypothetical protein